jgi:hypothetical protein
LEFIEMKNLLTTIALCAFMAPAAAVAQASEICPTIGSLAESIMTARQRGVPISQAYGLANDNALALEMIQQAWEKTRWHSDGAQLREVQDFKEQWEVACYRAQGVGA